MEGLVQESEAKVNVEGTASPGASLVSSCRFVDHAPAGALPLERLSVTPSSDGSHYRCWVTG